MSIKVSDRIWKSVYPHAGSELNVLLALADYSDDAGGSYPAVETLAEKVRLSRSQTQRVLRKLEEGGWLTVEGNRKGGFHPIASCRYRINLAALWPRAPENMRRRSAKAQPCGETRRIDAAQTFIDPPQKPQEPAVLKPGKTSEKYRGRGQAPSAPLAAAVQPQGIEPLRALADFYQEGVHDDGSF